MEKPSTFDRIGAALKRSAHGTALFTDSQRSARDELLDLARTRLRNLRRDHGTTVTVEQLLKEIFPNPGSSDGAIQLEWEPEGRSTWEVDYQLSFGFDGTALLHFATNDRSDVEVAILRSRNNSQLKIAVQADRIRVLPATKDDDDGTVLTTGQELLKAWNESGAVELVTLNVGRGELPVPVTGTVLDGIKRIGDRLEYVDPYMEIRTSRSARPQIVAWLQGRGILGDLERKYHVSFNAPQILAMREEARQVLEAKLYEVPTANENSANGAVVSARRSANQTLVVGSSTLANRRPRGPTPKTKEAIRIADIVNHVAPDGDWKPKLNEILAELDEAGEPLPPTWKKDGIRSWNMQARPQAVKLIERRMDTARKEPSDEATRCSSQALA